ncbi:MAG: hypothetical protein ACKOEM_14555 [Planctomycetia bacterium]
MRATTVHFLLKENPLTRGDLHDFVTCYHAADRTARKEAERFKAFCFDELSKRDKANLDIFWLKDASLEESANLPPLTWSPPGSWKTCPPHSTSSRRFPRALSRSLDRRRLRASGDRGGTLRPVRPGNPTFLKFIYAT